jgi:ribosome-binding protein aMBF1 (putative translation factor)
MTARTTKLRQPRGSRKVDSQLARLRPKVARLRAEVRALKAEKLRATEADVLPALPAPNADGNLPAEETLDAIVARQIIRRRRAAGWSQAELAARAAVRQETVSCLESGKHAPNVSTVDKLDRVLRAAGV